MWIRWKSKEWMERRQGRPPGCKSLKSILPKAGTADERRSDLTGNSQPGGWSRLIRFPTARCRIQSIPVERAFWTSDSSNYTATAVVGSPPNSLFFCISSRENFHARPQWLPDGASDVFAPGWDVSQHQVIIRNIVCRIRTGKPIFRKMQTLRCLELFWPAVAPDSAELMGFVLPKTLQHNRWSAG